LGSLLGGDSSIGKLLGGGGGTLLAGALGGSGLLGGGFAAALPALFSNPITAIIGGALIGGALLAKFFGNREFGKFRKEVDKEYQLKVQGDAQGKSLYKEVKEVGEQNFGKGQFGKKIIETIRLEEAKNMLAAYGEATGQTENPLVKRIMQAREIGDPSNPANKFVKREFGGNVYAGVPTVVGERRAEVFVPNTSGEIFESIAEFIRESFTLQSRAQGRGESLSLQQVVQMLRSMQFTNEQLIETLSQFGTITPETLLERTAKQRPDIFASATEQGLSEDQSTTNRFQRRLGIAS
jgi:hypothetical protein